MKKIKDPPKMMRDENRLKQLKAYYSTMPGFLSLLSDEAFDLLFEIRDAQRIAELISREHGKKIADLIVNRQIDAFRDWEKQHFVPYLVKLKKAENDEATGGLPRFHQSPETATSPAILERHPSEVNHSGGSADSTHKQIVSLQHAIAAVSEAHSQKKFQTARIVLCREFLKKHEIEGKPNYSAERLNNAIAKYLHK